MEFLKEVHGFLGDTSFAVPLAQVVLFVAIIAFCLLLGRHRLGLVITLCFVFFWSFVLNFKFFVHLLNDVKWGLQIYALTALLMFGLIVLGLFVQRSD
jgi:hypothetical protein